MLAQAAVAIHDPHTLLSVLPLAAISLLAYGQWLKRLPARGGRVSTEQIGVADLVFTVGIGTLFAFRAAVGFSIKQSPPLTTDLLLADAVLKIILMAVFGTFLAVRKVHMGALFGLRARPWPQVLGYGLLFLLAALPIMGAFGVLVEYFSPQRDEQNIVAFFRDQVKHGQVAGIFTVGLTAAIMAPIVEESIFRGHFYPTLKRYCGPVAAAIIVSALFALSHANVAALAPLFVLALCLTVAYEWTGSLLVPMTMHALFNSTSLAAMVWQAMHQK